MDGCVDGWMVDEKVGGLINGWTDNRREGGRDRSMGG